MLNKVWEFFKNPLYIQEEYSKNEKVKAFFRLLLITVGCSIALGLIMSGVASLVGFNVDDHAMVTLMEEFSPLIILVLAVLIAPLFEELFFRAPLALFKNPKYFKYAFYISVLFFGLIHITNFDNIDGFYWLIPLLVAPQISAGIFLGYTRTKLGLLWAILLHAAHNLILIGPLILIEVLDLSL